MGTRPNDPPAPRGAGPAPEQTSSRPTPAERTHDPVQLDPSDAEVDEWAARERQRREAWLSGPTQAERAAWAARERQRRSTDLTPGLGGEAAARARLTQRSVREAQLAAEGAASLLWKWSRRRLEGLVRAGREWEEQLAPPSRRRRVPLDDEVS